MQPYITIDTDNAVIRFYVTKARDAGTPNEVVQRIMLDLETLATALNHDHNTTYYVQGIL